MPISLQLVFASSLDYVPNEPKVRLSREHETPVHAERTAPRIAIVASDQEIEVLSVNPLLTNTFRVV